MTMKSICLLVYVFVYSHTFDGGWVGAIVCSAGATECATDGGCVGYVLRLILRCLDDILGAILGGCVGAADGGCVGDIDGA